MMNFFQKKEKEAKTNQHHSITFRVDSDDKTRLSKQADELKISLSEFVRKKVLMDDRELQNILRDYIILKQQNKEYEIEIRTKASRKIEPGAIIIQTTEEAKEILKKVFSQIRWNRFTNVKKEVEDDFELSAAIGFTLVEGIIEPMNDMNELRDKYNVVSIEKFFHQILGHYM